MGSYKCILRVLLCCWLWIFPDSALYFGTVLLVPGSIALILISIRGSFYAFEHYGQDTKLPWIVMYGLTGLLIPASLATVLTISEGGYINERGSHFDLDWFNYYLVHLLGQSSFSNH